MFLQSLLSGLQHRLMELLSKLLRGEAVPGFGASIHAVMTLLGLKREWRPKAVQQTGAPLRDRSFAGPPGLVWVDSWRRGFLWSYCFPQGFWVSTGGRWAVRGGAVWPDVAVVL